MASSTQWVKHVELYVDSSSTQIQQAASVDAVATLLKNDLLTLEALVREMEMYLTTTDSIIRSRGILMLAEVLAQLNSKPLSSTSLHSLIGFFTERLLDWRALRGAIAGCLALLRRKTDVGTLTDSEAKAVAQSYLQNLQVQSFGQHDRKLSFQLIECLLDRHSSAVADLGDDLVHGVCDAIDGEKDPECLLLVFRVVQSLAHLYPGPSSPLANYTEELFEILGSYFPIHFTHPRGEDDNVMKEELSRALMLAFASTPLFEPFCVPLLLEKLSSSLPSAKVESFRYLSYCTTKYGPDRMAKHAQSLWASLKDAIYVSPQSTLSVESSEFMGEMNFQESDIMKQAFALLREIIQQNDGFINLIIGDSDIKMFMNCLNQHKEFDDIPVLGKQRLHAVGQLLSVCAKSSVALCNKVFEGFLPVVMDALGFPVSKSPDSGHPDENHFSLVKFNFGALYLCVELLAACRDLVLSLDNSALIPDFALQTSYVMLNKYSESLAKAFILVLRSNVADNSQSAYVYFGVKGLQNLATYPGKFLPVSKSIYENIMQDLVSIVTSDVNRRLLWTLALKALVEIGVYNDKCSDSDKAASFESAVVDKVVSLISSDDSALPTSLKLQAAFDIGATKKEYMLRVVEDLDKATSTNLSTAYAHENLESHKLTVDLLDAYSLKVLQWSIETGGFEEIPLSFALMIWDKVENCGSFNLGPPESSNVLAATMNAMKKAVGICLEESQEIIINKAFGVLSSNSSRQLGFDSGSSIPKAELLTNTHNFANSSSRDELLASLFASVVIALRPGTCIPSGKMILMMFIKNVLHGHVPSAQALGSLVNKLPLGTTKLDSSKNCSLNEALDMIFHAFMGTSCYGSDPRDDESEVDFGGLSLSAGKIQSVGIHTVIGLGWIGKGLLMRGHEKVKEITMTLLSFLTLNHSTGMSKQLLDLIKFCEGEDMYQLMKFSGDAFHIIMSDSDSCMNRMYHATIRPLYKQRFFSSIMPILLPLLVKSEPSFDRSMLYRAFAHVVSDTPLTAVLGEAKKLLPVLLDCLYMLSKDVLNKGIIYDVLLVISGILVDKNGQEAAIENASSLVNQLTDLTTYPHVTAIREIALQCLVAMTELPYKRIYPLRRQVLQATSKALDDPKRIVRKEAVRCRQTWASIASRSLHF